MIIVKVKCRLFYPESLHSVERVQYIGRWLSVVSQEQGELPPVCERSWRGVRIEKGHEKSKEYTTPSSTVSFGSNRRR